MADAERYEGDLEAAGRHGVETDDDRLPGIEAPGLYVRHPWLRFVALGDSFTEGVGDPEPTSPNGVRGWADRVAEELAEDAPGFAYANLAIRGRLLDQILAEQVEPAIALQPDLITISAGGNDMIRPGADPDAIAARFERGVEQLRRTGATVVIFTGVDTRFQPVFASMRGRIAIYNENLRAVAAHHNAIVADQWALRSIQRPAMWTDDRLHLNPYGHHEVARMVLDALAVPNSLRPMAPEAVRPSRWRDARVRDIVWAREHLVPWVVRRIRHQSSGDRISAKRPFAEPLFRPGELDETVAGAVPGDSALETGGGSNAPQSPSPLSSPDQFPLDQSSPDQSSPGA
ncbi:hypothetical protein GCM10011490_02920 [Pseudoclavibacter endophyticus]|uniref:SGNH/GDSL hydrolase family protein n=1 Tax=Pseudoclavibacter endophyticus TaxID=1778590 RepID=A0A6H9WMT2_9MICO|nr:SGNH/GDSL hydrolase family protein [Pseudoclavibacter endophyticus]GGA56499.1 hypothetical protein GCM10011490_02920 [Pseudoclavibacter endophyticus]